MACVLLSPLQVLIIIEFTTEDERGRRRTRWILEAGGETGGEGREGNEVRDTQRPSSSHHHLIHENVIV